MSAKISFGLSIKEVQNAIKEIKAYQNDLNRKCEELCRRLAELGVNKANSTIENSGFKKHIHIMSEITPEQAGCKAVVYMEDVSKIKSEWRVSDTETRSAELSPSLVLEFGTGLKAKNPAGIDGVGAGTFGEHGADPSGWWYMDLDGVWHHSKGIEPKMPMYYAGKELREKILVIAREVFGT